MRRTLVAGAVASVLTAFIQLPSPAATTLELVDPAGDAVASQANQDIIGLTYALRPVKEGDKASIIVTMKLSAPPAAQLVTYWAYSEIPGCGNLAFRYAPGTVYSQIVGRTLEVFVCGELLPTRGSVKGSTIMWSIVPEGLPKAARDGKTLLKIRGYTTFSEPALGLYGNGETDTGQRVTGVPTDEVKTDKGWTFA